MEVRPRNIHVAPDAPALVSINEAPPNGLFYFRAFCFYFPFYLPAGICRSGFLPDGKDFEGTEHDGDVEDYSDNESTEPDQLEKLMYYPQNEEMSR